MLVGGNVQVVAEVEGDCVALGLGRRAQTRSSSCLAVVTIGGGTVQAVAVFKSNCEVLGLWLRAQSRLSSCLVAGCNRNGVVRAAPAVNGWVSREQLAITFSFYDNLKVPI